MARANNLQEALENIRDPRRWAGPDVLYEVIQSTPSVRGIVYGNVAEAEFSTWLVNHDVPLDKQSRDDDHKKTKSDRTIIWEGRQYTIQVKSPQTNSIKELSEGRFSFDVQVDASDRRPVDLPNGHTVTTTSYVVGEFDLLAVPLHAFTGEWDFLFMLNDDLPRTTWSKYAEEDRQYLLKTTIQLEFPIPSTSAATSDLFELIRSAGDLGTLIAVTPEEKIVRPPGEDEVVVIHEKDEDTGA